MNKVLHTANEYSFQGKLYVTVVVLLLIAFTAKISLATVYINITSQKINKTLVNENGDQDNGDEKEEGKFAAKQMSEYISPAFLQIGPVFRQARMLLHHTYLSQFVKAYSLTVLTPPPNC